MKQENSNISANEKQVKKCSVEKCEQNAKTNGFCSRHYSQMCFYGKILTRTKFDKNTFVFKDDMCIIQLYDVKHNPIAQALIDTNDYEKVKDYKWCVNQKIQMVKNDQIGYLSRFIMGVTDPTIEVDHINHNRFDNRKENLRISTRTENSRNTSLRSDNTSGYKGVSWSTEKQKWVARIQTGEKYEHLGYFHSKKQAAKAYNKAAKKYFGTFAWLNKIE